MTKAKDKASPEPSKTDTPAEVVVSRPTPSAPKTEDPSGKEIVERNGARFVRVGEASKGTTILRPLGQGE